MSVYNGIAHKDMTHTVTTEHIQCFNWVYTVITEHITTEHTTSEDITNVHITTGHVTFRLSTKALSIKHAGLAYTESITVIPSTS